MREKEKTNKILTLTFLHIFSSGALVAQCLRWPQESPHGQRCHPCQPSLPLGLENKCHSYQRNSHQKPGTLSILALQGKLVVLKTKLNFIILPIDVNILLGSRSNVMLKLILDIYQQFQYTLHCLGSKFSLSLHPIFPCTCIKCNMVTAPLQQKDLLIDLLKLTSHLKQVQSGHTYLLKLKNKTH